jgi:hypothetical protein
VVGRGLRIRHVNSEEEMKLVNRIIGHIFAKVKK